MNYQVLIQSVRIGLYALVIFLLVISSVIERNFFSWTLAWVFYSFAGVGVLINLIPFYRLDSFFKNTPLVFFSFVIDIVLTTGLIVYSQLNQALFLFLYLVLIILSGLVFRSRGAYIIAALVSISYTIASWFGPEVKALSFLFLMILNNIFFFVVAFLAGFLSDQLSLFAEKIELQNVSIRVIRKLNEMIVETIPLGLLSVNSETQVIQYNPGAASIFGNDHLNAGQNLGEKLPGLLRSNQNLKQLEGKLEFDYNWKLSDDEVRFLKFQIIPQNIEFAEKTYLVVVDDQTEQQRLEFAVRQSEKLAAVGQLAAGIAHEIRNPLAGISGSIELLSQNFSNEDDKKLGKIILKEIDRLNRLISEFLDFAKPETPPSEGVNINSLIEEVAKASITGVGRSVKFEKNFSALSDVLGHKDKLKQVFLNIIVNALQAMEKVQEPQLTITTEASEGRLLIKIKDNGAGMKEETRKRMFEPFHTTKPKGTGLGLAITLKILQSHNAQVYVSSELGLGTEFVISFPMKNN
jgi:two-component system sensor histidine kinase PilS (NtrC family)